MTGDDVAIILELSRQISGADDYQTLERVIMELISKFYGNVQVSILAPDGTSLSSDTPGEGLTPYPKNGTPLKPVTYFPVRHHQEVLCHILVSSEMLIPDDHPMIRVIADYMAMSIIRIRQKEAIDETLEKQQTLVEELVEARVTLDEGQKLSNTASWRWIPSTGVIHWSAETYRMYGSDPRDGPWTVERFMERVHPDDRASVEKSSAEVLKGGNVIEDEYRIVMPDGSLKHLRSRAVAKRIDGEVTEVVGLATDVTSERMVQEKLAAMQEDAAKAARLAAVGVISATIAHDLSQPLAALLTNVSAAKRWLQNDTPQIFEAIDCLVMAEANAQRVRDLVKGVRELIQNREITPSQFNPRELAAECFTLLADDLKRHGVRHQIVSEEELVAYADKPKIRQVMLNLIKNAIEAHRASSSAMRSIVIHVARKSNSAIEIEISDNGPGVSDRDRDRLFSPLFTTKEDGMGVGLAICRSVVRLHGGDLYFRASEGGGAIFSFEIPRLGEL